MMERQTAEVELSVLLFDETGCLPGRHSTWFERAANWRVRRVETLGEAMKHLRIEPPNSVLFVPAGKDGFDCAATLRTIRSLRPEIVVGIVLDGPLSEENRWLDAGADFVTILPFHLDQVAARLRAALRLQETAFQRGLERRGAAVATPLHLPLIAFGEGYQFNPVTGIVTDRACRPMALTPHELAVLTALARHPNQPLSRDEICRTAFGRPWIYGDRCVDRAIMSLRQRLALDPVRGPIRGRRNAGYLLLSREDGREG